mmetsp:Transcript_43183/g.134290  ORF Transcript_43183/g.134290 Transcript_43183/m.134290 type:complete len:236 (-) Transcript_43183:93-800(-)
MRSSSSWKVPPASSASSHCARSACPSRTRFIRRSSCATCPAEGPSSTASLRTGRGIGSRRAMPSGSIRTTLTRTLPSTSTRRTTGTAALVEMQGPPEAAAGDAPPAADAGGSDRQLRGRGAHRSSEGTMGTMRGRGRGRPKRRFGADACGRIIDLRYRDWQRTYRVRVVKYDKAANHHHIHSRGLSTWDDESFEDEIDLNAMYDCGDVKFVDSDGDSEEEDSEARNPRRSRRLRR